MEKYRYDDATALAAAQKALLRYNALMRFPLGESDIDTTLFAEYFRTTDPAEEAHIERRLAAAAALACYNDPDIFNKKKNALLMGQQFVDVAQASKIDYLWNTGAYGPGIEANRRYEAEKKKHAVCRKAAFFDSVKKTLTRMPAAAARRHVAGYMAGMATTAGLVGEAGLIVSVGGLSFACPPAAVAFAIGTAINVAVTAIVRLTPPEVKAKLKEGVAKVADKAVAVVENVGRKLKSIPAVRKVCEVTSKYVTPVVRAAATATKNAYEKLKSATNKVGKWIKSLF